MNNTQSDIDREERLRDEGRRDDSRDSASQELDANRKKLEGEQSRLEARLARINNPGFPSPQVGDIVILRGVPLNMNVDDPAIVNTVSGPNVNESIGEDHYIISCTVFPSDGNGVVRRLTSIPVFADGAASLLYRPNDNPYPVRAYVPHAKRDATGDVIVVDSEDSEVGVRRVAKRK